jgi:hypothetical protein
MLYKIYEMNFEKFEKKMKWAINKIAKIGNGSLSYKVVGESFVELKIKGKKVPFKLFHIEAEFETPCINGWEFSATICHNHNGNVINVLPSFGRGVPMSYFQAVHTTCEHCNSNRYRKDTFLLYNVEEKTFKQVGRQCLKDFLGYIQPEHYAKLAEFFAGLKDDEIDENDESFSGGHYVIYGNTLEWLAMSKAVVDLFGQYVSKAKAEENNDYSTESRVYEQFDNFKLRVEKLRKLGIKIETIPDSCYGFANEAIEHLKAIEPQNTYEGNLKVITNSEYFDYKFSGYMTSVVSFYQRFLDKREYKARQAKERAKMPISCYCGTIGKREDFTLIVTKSLAFEGYYGITYINLMKDSKGNVFTWSTGKRLHEGSTYLIKGTVKEHSEYKNIKQTTLTRCKVLKEFEAETVEKVETVNCYCQ